MQRFTKLVSSAAGLVLFGICAIGALALAGLALLYGIFSGWIVIIAFGLMVGGFYSLFQKVDKTQSWELTRVVLTLLATLLVDVVLFAIVRSIVHREAGYFAPAVIVASLTAGYLLWKSLAIDAAKEYEKNPYAVFAAIALSIFLLFYVISPFMDRVFPGYWQSMRMSASQGQ